MRTLIRPGAFHQDSVREPMRSAASLPAASGEEPSNSVVAAVSQAVRSEPASLTVICSWCDRVLREGTGRVTHTICEPCMERVLGDAA